VSRISFTVLGRPAPQGSMKAFMAGNHARVRSDNKATMPWRQQVGQTALAMRPTPNIWAQRHVPVAIEMLFYFAPPKKLPKGRVRPAVKPDIDKLQRAIFDSMSGIMYMDDGQIVGVNTGKFYGLPERVEIVLVTCD
jgi:Holliday junction resolvase RusA-like endonuclease